MKKEIKIPDIAENVESGHIAGILVSKGDHVSADQSVVEVETDKATTDIPSPYEGEVVEIKVSQGDEVKVGQVIMVIEVGEGQEGGDEKEDGEKEKEHKGKVKPKAKDNGADDEDTDDEDTDDEVTDDEVTDDQISEKQDEDDEDGEDGEDGKEKEEQDIAEKKKTDPSDIPASPSVRRMAREMEVDLTQIEGSGPGKRITAEDVEKAASGKKSDRPRTSTKLPDFSQWGPTSREPMNNVRKITARSLQESWGITPQVTQFDEADVTNLEQFRQQHAQRVEKQGGKLTVTALLLKLSAFALQKFPRFNASVDLENEEIIYKHYCHISIAVDTPQGLLVPVIRDVDKKPLVQLSVELTDIAERARNKKIKPEELQGGNFTLSNLGGIGGTAFSPIVYAPQVAIMGVSRSNYQPRYDGDEIKKRMILPLSLSYDHRIIDGVDGAKFLRWVCDVIEDPYAVLF
jgi:pyruvate dehydrogenase E2 component (dihydrolipoamide acetyltransferase)